LRRFLTRTEPSEPRAFEELLSAHFDALYRTALYLCSGQRADAEDLLQDVMVRAFQHFRELRDPAAGKSWLFTILVRANLNRLRSQRRRAERTISDLTEQEFEQALALWTNRETLDDSFDLSSVRQHLTATLNSLGDELRAVIWLSDVEGFKQREIAHQLDIPEGTVASRLFRARGRLRERLQQLAPEIGARKDA
jgi:RNA polymerase sigma-70 factor, ECF subfamily